MRREGSEMKTMSAVLFTLLLASFAQAQLEWTRTYGGTNYDEGYSVRQTSDSGYIIAGVTNSFGAGSNDVYLVKTDAYGDTLWTRTYGGTNDDQGYSVQQTSDGGYVIAGFTQSFGAGNYDVWLIKTNASGDTLWAKTCGGANDDRGYSVQQTSDSGYIVTGFTKSFGAGLEDVYLIKTDASGDTLWTRTYGGTYTDEGYSVQQTLDGGYVVAGYTWSFSTNNYDAWLIKTNASGDTLWTCTCHGANNDRGYSVQQTSDSGYIVTGWTNSFGAGDYDAYLIKTNASGDTLWTKHLGGTGDDFGSWVRQTSDGGYIIAGYTNSFGAGNNDVWLVKTNASGDTLWTATYGGTPYDLGYSVQQTSDGGYIIAGVTTSFGAGHEDFYIIKADANGNAGVEEKSTPGLTVKCQGAIVTPNPFTCFARIPGHETERFDLYDISGKLVGAYPGNRIGEGLSPAVYFIKLDAEHGRALRIVKVR
jgi:uncharacterized delta-60 repeat protein